MQIHLNGTAMMPDHRTARSRMLIVCALIVAPLAMLRAQTAVRAADVPSRSAEARVQSDSLTVHFLRTPKGKPAALSVGGRTAAQARKFSGKAEAAQRAAPPETPLPERARTTKP